MNQQLKQGYYFNLTSTPEFNNNSSLNIKYKIILNFRKKNKNPPTQD